MKKKLIKIIVVMILIIMIGAYLNVVKAAVSDNQVKHFIEEFCDDLEDGDSYVYNYIDTDNRELYNGVSNYAGLLKSLKYKVTSILEDDDVIHVKGNVKVKGENFKIEGFTVKFDLKRAGDTYKITDTDLFYKISPTHTIKFVSSILILVFGIIGGVVLITAITAVIVILVIRKNKKNKENKEI